VPKPSSPTPAPRHSAAPRHRRSAVRRRRGRLPLAGPVAGLIAVLVLAVAVLAGAPSAATESASGGDGLAPTRWSSWWSRHQERAEDRARPARSTSPTTSSTTTPSRTAQSSTTSTATQSTAKSSTTTPSTTKSSTTTGTAPSGQSGATVSGGPFIAYSADSLFRKPLPAVTPVSPTSAQGVAFAKANDPSPYLKIRGAQGVGWGIAYAMAGCSDPVYRIGSGGTVPASQQHLRTVGFHAPASVWQNIPPNGDAPFLVIDTCGTSARPAGQSVWGANASVSGQTVSVSAAGSFSHDSNGLDRRNPASNSQLNERSRGVIPDSMAIRIDLLDRAIRNGTGLGHVLEVFWLETDSSAGPFSPMVGAENGQSGYGAEGERLRIKPGIDLASRPGCSPTTNPVGLAIARTLQQNGAYLGDNSGSGSGIKTEQNANYPGLTADSLRGCMTWDDIEFLPRGWTP
jgi:hypothetical protein